MHIKFILSIFSVQFSMLSILTLCNQSPELSHLVKLKLYTHQTTSPFQRLDYDVPGCELFWVFIVWVQSASQICSLYLLPNLGHFSHYFLRSTFFSAFWDFGNMLNLLLMSPRLLRLSSSLLPVFFLLLGAGNFYCSIFIFTDSCHPHSSVEPM